MYYYVFGNHKILILLFLIAKPGIKAIEPFALMLHWEV